MKLNEDLYAVVRPDGSVAGNGDGPCLHKSPRWATDDATDSFVQSRNGGVPLRVARVRLVEVEEAK